MEIMVIVDANVKNTMLQIFVTICSKEKNPQQGTINLFLMQKNTPD